MKNLILCLVALFLLAPAVANAQRGEKAMGVLSGYNTNNKSVIAGIFFQYRFSEYFRLAPDFQYIFKHNDESAFQFNGNAHFPLKIDTKLNIYPFAGISYQSWRISNIADLDNNDNLTFNKFGLNLGGGIEFNASPTLKIILEGKYSLIKIYSSAGFTAGIGYVF